VATGRKLTKEQVDAVGQGRVWTGEQAKTHRLVDELGGLRQALAEARRLADLPEYAPIQELPVIESSIVGRLLGLEGVKAGEQLPLPGELYDMARALAPFAVHPSDKPLARMEFVPVAP
jgi:protease-4